MLFFVYVMRTEGTIVPHVVQGPTMESLEETRRLVISGAQVKSLLYVSAIVNRSEMLETMQHVQALRTGT